MPIWSMLFLIIYLIALALVSFCFFFADNHAPGLLGDVSRLLLVQLPDLFQQGITSLFGEKAYMYLHRWWLYFTKERNPLFQLTYLFILDGSYIAWLLKGQPLLPVLFVKSHHSYIAFIGVLICHGTFIAACSIGPGTIKSSNLTCYRHIPFDEVLFADGRICSTCNIPKPARSKHCSMCGMCVAISDHHCVWLNQCVGEQNYRYFLSFLFVHVMYFAYAAVVTFLVVYSEIAERDLLNVTFVNPTTRMEFKATTWMILMYLLNTKGYVVAICILASVMMCAILGFFVYHLILIGYGMTTNESIKWGSLRKFHNVLLDAHKKYSNCTPEELEEHRRKGTCAFKDGGENANDDSSYNNDDLVMAENTKKGKFVSHNSDIVENDSDDTNTEHENGVQDDFVGCVPVSAEEDLSNLTSSAAHLRKVLQTLQHDVDGRQIIPEVLEMHPGELPENIYNKGFFINMYNIIFPTSLSLLARRNEQNTNGNDANTNVPRYSSKTHKKNNKKENHIEEKNLIGSNQSSKKNK